MCVEGLPWAAFLLQSLAPEPRLDSGVFGYPRMDTMVTANLNTHNVLTVSPELVRDWLDVWHAFAPYDEVWKNHRDCPSYRDYAVQIIGYPSWNDFEMDYGPRALDRMQGLQDVFAVAPTGSSTCNVE